MLSYQFPAVKGFQADSEYYICMIPLELLPKVFLFDNTDKIPEYRAQRKLNEARIPEIRDYIINNRASYVFSALAASVDGEMIFKPIADNLNIGLLEIDMSAAFLINDGQHRKAAIQAAMIEDESLAKETIPVVLFKDKGLERSQQMFSDLNKHAVITSKSLNTLYESKDEIALITKKIINNIDFLRKYTDKEKDNLGKFSSNIFTLNIFYSANKRILKKSTDIPSVESFIFSFWQNVVNNITEWNEMYRGDLSKKDLRENYIITQGVTILAFGQLGQFYYHNKGINMTESLEKLREIDWLRNNTKYWMHRAVKQNGAINRNEHGIQLTYIQIKRLLELDISNEEIEKERAAGLL